MEFFHIGFGLKYAIA